MPLYKMAEKQVIKDKHYFDQNIFGGKCLLSKLHHK